MEKYEVNRTVTPSGKVIIQYSNGEVKNLKAPEAPVDVTIEHGGDSSLNSKKIFTDDELRERGYQ